LFMIDLPFLVLLERIRVRPQRGRNLTGPRFELSTVRIEHI